MHEVPVFYPYELLEGTLVLLTRPCPTWSLKHWGKWMHEQIKGGPYEGHRALVQATLLGLKRLGQKTALNPLLWPKDTRFVLCSWGNDTIVFASKKKSQASHAPFDIGLAPTGIPLNLAGTQDLDLLMESVSMIFPASAWHSFSIHNRFKTQDTSNRYHPWPTGVDTQWWIPSLKRAKKSRHLLIYKKACHEHLLGEALQVIQKTGWSHEIIEYGHYRPEQFREALQRSELALFLSWSETQGIALAEAWSCDVPTLAWHSERGSHYQYTAPWLGPRCGALYHDPSDLESFLTSDLTQKGFEPRKWTIDNMSVEASAKMLLGFIHQHPLEKVRNPSQKPS